MRTAGMALALCLVLAGCGESSDAVKKPATSSKTTTAASPPPKATPSAKPKVAAATGVPAPADLRDFQCFADDNGTWNSSGLLENTSKKSVSYQVTVFVGKANGKDAKAVTKPFNFIRAGTSIRVELNKLPAADDATQCYVRVLAKPSGS